MASYTPNYNLDKYDGTDKPNLRDQYNSAMDKIDTALKQISDEAGSGGGTTYTGTAPINVSGTTISVANASQSATGVVRLAASVDAASTTQVPTASQVKSYVDAHAGTGGVTAATGSNGVNASVTGSTVQVSGINASTAAPGVVTLTSDVSANSSTQVPTAAAVKSYVDANAGGGTSGVTSVNASNGVTGNVSGTTLTISGVNATASTPGVVQKVSNITGGSTSAVPDCSAVIQYVEEQMQESSSGVTSINAGTGIQVSSSTGAVTVSARSASTSQAGIVQLATNGTSSVTAATPSYVNTVQQNLSTATNVLHQSLSGSASGMTSMEGDVFIFTGLGIGIAMLYAQTSSDMTAGEQKKYSYTIPSQYRPPQQAQVLRLYNHISGSGILAQVRTDGSICWSCEGGTGAGFVGAAVVTWAFEV